MTRSALVDASTFRGTLSRWASGVAVVTAVDGPDVAATTVSSFTSLSLDPPLVLVALSAKSRTLKRIESTGGEFSVSVLSATQQNVAEQCASLEPAARALFDDRGFVHGAIAALACRVHDIRPYGDHLLVVGEVRMARHNEDDAPLLYWNRGYRALHPGDDQTTT